MKINSIIHLFNFDSLMKNRLLTLFAAMLCTYNAWSQVFFEYNNINYRADGTDEVTAISTSYLAAYDTHYDIPETVSYEGKEYRVTKIGNSAFAFRTNLKTINLPESITLIDISAFEGCSSLENIELPKKLITLNYYAFENCTSLQSVVIPDSIRTIEEGAFQGCSQLQTLDLPETLEKIGTFSGCASLSAIRVSENNPYYASVDGVLFNKEKDRLIKYPEDKAGQSFALPAGVSVIEAYAFSDNVNLVTVTASESLDTIKYAAFHNSAALEEFNIPASTSLEDNAFEGCLKLQALNADPENPRYSSEDGILFDKQKKTILIYPCGKTATHYTIPDGITAIHNSAFATCHNLESIDCPESVTSIGTSAFMSCTSLKSITLPQHLDKINGGVFCNCQSLQSITLPESITSIEFMAFSSCRSLESINFPDAITRIGNQAFEFCPSLVSVKLPASLTEIGEYAFYGTGITEITIPESVTELNQSSFSYCLQLTSIRLPQGLTRIAAGLLSYCSSLDSITIPKNVSMIEQMAFASCNNLSAIRCEAVTPPATDEWGLGSVFYDIPTDIPVYVPKASIEKYKADPLWSVFTNYQGFVTGLHQITDETNISVIGGTLHNPKNLTLKIYDANGRQVYQGHNNTISLPAGIYIIRCGNHTLKAAF